MKKILLIAAALLVSMGANAQSYIQRMSPDGIFSIENGVTGFKAFQLDKDGIESDTVKMSYFDEFVGDTIDAKWNGATGSSTDVVTATIVTPAADANGVMSLRSGSACVANTCNASVWNTGLLQARPISGTTAFIARVNLNAVTSASVFVGFANTGGAVRPIQVTGAVATANVSNSVGLLFDTNASASLRNWVMVGVSGTTTLSVVSTGVTPTATRYDTLKVLVNRDGSAEFSINDRFIARRSLSVISSTALTPFIGVYSNDTLSRTLLVDFVKGHGVR